MTSNIATSTGQENLSQDTPVWRASSRSASRTPLATTGSPVPEQAAAAASAAAAATTTMKALDLSTYPNGKKSLSGISLRAFLLGTTLGLSTCLTIYLIVAQGDPLWRAPFFLSSLCLFHFLEFYVTAQYNTREASISAYLLTSNGWAYNIAHGSALLECLIGYTFYADSHYYPPLPIETITGLKLSALLGITLMLLGQTIRTIAMAQAGSNFNHTVQAEYKEGHTLVQNGVYALSRHPSYFGFFWWGLGTQLVLGNGVCFVGYMVVLWRFFFKRIQREEKFLLLFFGDDYLDYKKSTWVGIPGIK